MNYTQMAHMSDGVQIVSPYLIQLYLDVLIFRVIKLDLHQDFTP